MGGHKEGPSKPELNKSEREREQAPSLHCFSSSIREVLMPHRLLNKMPHRPLQCLKVSDSNHALSAFTFPRWSSVAWSSAFHRHVDYVIPIRHQSPWELGSQQTSHPLSAAFVNVTTRLAGFSMWGVNLKLHSALELCPGS